MADFVVNNITVETSGAFEGSLYMGGNNIHNLAQGIEGTDAVNVTQLTTAIESVSGGITLQNVTSNGNTTTNGIVVGDDSTFQNNLTVLGDLYVQGTEYITNTEIISGNQIVVGELHVDGDSYLGNSSTDTVFISGGLYVGGDTQIGGTLNMTSGQINNLQAGTAATDAVNLGQVESLIAAASGAETLAQILAQGNTSGGSIIDMQSAQIINVGTPTVSGDAANKAYVDSIVAASSGAAIEQGTTTGASFSGNPKTFTVIFSQAFADTNYSITISSEAQRVWTFTSKATTGFTINANANRAFTEEVDWVAVKK